MCKYFVTFIYIQKQEIERSGMYTTVNEEGILNNYAPEVTLHYAEYPSQEQQRRYMFQGALAILFVSFLVLTTLAVS